MNISASIVIYNSKPEDIIDCIDSFFASGGKNILIIDNKSINNTPKILENHYHGKAEIQFFSADENLGYGGGHNLAIKTLKKHNKFQDFHIILNPDVVIMKDCLKILHDFIKSDANISLAVPRILNPDLTLQPLNKEFPTVFDMFLRFIPKKIAKIFQKRMDSYIRMQIGYDKICEVPFASGCFMFFRSEILDKIDGFDADFFLYMEDADICKRTLGHGKILFNPNAKIIHKWQRESHKSIKMTIIMVKSMIKYFNKHGWRFFSRGV